MAKSSVTDERRAEIKKWVYKFFVEVWDRKFTPSSDTQSTLLNYLCRDAISDEGLNEVWEATKSWVRFYKAEAASGKKVSLPCACVWYNEHRYDNPVPSTMDAKIQREVGKCKCGNDVIGDRFKTCVDCLLDPRKRQNYEALGEFKKQPDESVTDWRMRCKNHVQGKLKGSASRLLKTI